MHTRILVATTLVVAALNAHAHAQPTPVPKDGRVTITLRLAPNDYLRPASRAHLLPEYAESIPGNRVQMFLRCFMEQTYFFGQAESEQRDKWNALPLNELPLKAKNYGGKLTSEYMYDAARMTQVDWQLWYFIRRDGYNTILPDAQKMRQLATALKTRVRGDIAFGNDAEAFRTLKTMLGLARTFDAHPTLVGHLIGTAIAAITVDAIEELMQKPGSPNLYWALSDLPHPFLSLRMGMEGEQLMLGDDIAMLKASPVAVAESLVLKQIEYLGPILEIESKEKSKSSPAAVGELGTIPYKAILQKKAANADEVRTAREGLVGLGLPAAHVQAWSPMHVIFIDDIMHYELYRDELAKYMNLPYWQAKPGIDETLAEISRLKQHLPALVMVSAVATVKVAQARLDQRFAYLQIIEAIRLHAFKNDGTLPARLTDIKLPLPVDPITGKPFEYSVEKGVATLHGQNPLPGTDATNRYYEIILNKK
jgi:hypothetical protein